MTIAAVQRRREIIKALQENGTVSVAELAEKLGVSLATVRRDLTFLEEQQHLGRTHGGAVILSNPSYEPAFLERAQELAEEKASIAKLAAEMVQPGDVVALDSGTTVGEMVPHIRHKAPLTVITTALNVATRMCDFEGVTVILPGGIVKGKTMALVGPPAEKNLAELRANKAFMGCSALSVADGAMAYNLLTAGVKRALAATADQVIVLADHSKFGRAALAAVTRPEGIHTLVTDWGTSREYIEHFQAKGVQVLIATKPSAGHEGGQADG